jgi:hypothetical protein
MKKSIIVLLMAAPFVFQFCSSTKKAQAQAPALVTYDANVHPVIMSNCTPCHVPPGGNKKAYNNYANTKSDIDDIISRISKNPNDRGFMPFKHPKLPDSTIQVFVKWKNDGLLEK